MCDNLLKYEKFDQVIDILGGSPKLSPEKSFYRLIFVVLNSCIISLAPMTFFK